jgi:hypothetical protein
MLNVIRGECRGAVSLGIYNYKNFIESVENEEFINFESGRKNNKMPKNLIVVATPSGREQKLVWTEFSTVS